MNDNVIHWCWPEALDDWPALRDRLVAMGELRVDANLPGIGEQVNVLVPRLMHEVNERTIAGWPSLRVVATPTTGTDHIDVAALQRRGITLLSLKDDRAFLDSVTATAELAWLLILSSVRRLREAIALPLDGRFQAMDVRGHDLSGRTLGIVGLGRLGTMVARFGQAFRMRVIACDVRPVQVDGVTMMDLSRLLHKADVVSVHVHLNETTNHLIGADQFRAMKPGAAFVNTSRGGVVDELALLESLQSGHLSAAGVDVLDGERVVSEVGHPLIEFARRDPRLIITPHAGGCTVESQRKAFDRIVQRLEELRGAR